MVCLIVIFVFSVVNSHYLIGYTIDSNGYCSIRHYKWYEANYSRLNVVYLLSYSIMPFTIITICNFFIVLSVCQNKTNMKKKYEIKKPRLLSSTKNSQEPKCTPKSSLQICDEPTRLLKSDPSSTETNSRNGSKHEMFILIKDDKVSNHLLDSNCKFFRYFCFYERKDDYSYFSQLAT
jgi:hypothetical protein